MFRVRDELAVFAERTATGDTRRFELVPLRIDEARGNGWAAVVQGPPRGTPIVTSGGIMLLGML